VKRKALISVLAVGLVLVGATSAQAGKWSFGNGESDLEVGSAPRTDGFTGFVCTNRIHGRAGLGTSTLPAPAGPYSPLTVKVFTGAPGDLGGAEVVPGGLLLLDGRMIQPVATQTTAAPTKLKPLEHYTGFSQDDDIWEYASAPFAFTLAPGQIAPGNDVLIVQGGHSAYVTKTAQACPNQKTWSGRVWNTVTQGNVTPAQTSKQLSFTLGTTGTADLQGTYFTDCTFSGALTAKVHYTLNTWPSTNGVRVGLLVNNPDYPSPNGSVTAERTSFAASGDVSTGEKYVSNGTDSGGAFVTKATSATSGDLRIRVNAGVYRAEYRDATTGTTWTLIGTAPVYDNPVSIGLQVWAGHSLFHGPVKATFSSFAISKGVCA
jgi:hypothetical protein